MRKKLMAANWKMYKTPDQTRDFFRDFLPLIADHTRDEIAVCPSFVCLAAAVEAAKGSHVAIGGQNLHWEKEGAYTGEISAGMLLAVGCTHVIIGHSERRQYFGETDDTVNLKLKTALEADLIPIVCVGEVLEEREAGLTEDVLRRQSAGSVGANSPSLGRRNQSYFSCVQSGHKFRRRQNPRTHVALSSRQARLGLTRLGGRFADS